MVYGGDMKYDLLAGFSGYNLHISFVSYDDSIAATLTGFVTLTMFLTCSNAITIRPDVFSGWDDHS